MKNFNFFFLSKKYFLFLQFTRKKNNSYRNIRINYILWHSYLIFDDIPIKKNKNKLENKIIILQI
jgi:hypothetical protein